MEVGVSCKKISILIGLSLLAAGLLSAQTTFGIIRGRVLDPTGAAIPNVNVVVTNTGTNISRTVATNASGNYEAGYLQPGTYSVAAEAAGFKKFVSEGLVLSANAIVLVDVNLSVGELTSSVTVEAGAPLISTETATVTDVKTQEQYLKAPMNVRGNWDSFLFNFMSLVPGVQPMGTGFSISFAGSRYTANNFTVDGITTNSVLYGNIVGPANPSMDFIQEVKVDVSGTSAEFGAPGYVGVITKGGGNQIHGSGFWYYNSAGFNARNPFQDRVAFAVLNDYGFTVTGPVVRNKTFFSGGLEGFNQHTSAEFNLSLPTDRMRSGDFSVLKDTAGRALNVVVNDPFTNTPFGGNMIPPSRLNSSAVKTQERFYPHVNFGDPDMVAGNFRDQAKQTLRKEQIDIRIDHQFTAKNFFFGRFDAMRSPNGTWEGNLPTVGPRVQRRQTRNLIFSDTHTFSPTVINEFRYGLIRGYNPYSGPVDGPTVVQEMGLTNLPADLPKLQAIPTVSISNFQGISQIDYQRGAEVIHQWQDNLSWTKGNHTLKFGVEIWRNYGQNYGVSPSRAYGSVSFTGNYSGYSYADFMLGIPRSASRTAAGFVLLESTNWDKFFFVQDDFKISPRLTLNFGLRYELNPPYAEVQDRLYSFNPYTGKMVVPNEKAKAALFSGFVASDLVPIVTAREAGIPERTLAHTDKNNIAPRFGFAYKLTSDNKTVVRGGFGIFYDTYTAALWRSMVGGPYNGSESSPINTITNGQALWMWPDMFPRVLTQSGTASLSGQDPNTTVPYTEQWSLTLEREMWNMGWRAAYVGSKTHQLLASRNLNQLFPSTVAYSPSRRPYPQLSGASWRENMLSAYYNGLTLSAERKYKAGLQYQVAYTWAKNLTDSHDDWEAGWGAQNAYDHRSEWADNAYTRRHRFVFNSIWDLPFGKNQKFVREGVLSQIIGGWAISTFGVLQTGRYYTPGFSTYDPANTGASGGRPDRVGNGNLSNPTTGAWFDKNAFRVPGDVNGDGTPDVQVGRFGNSGLNILRGPGTRSMNAGFFKSFVLREGWKLQAEATFTNFFNHPNFGIPNATINSGSAGLITQTQNQQYSAHEGSGPRTTRFGLRLDF
jgi:hypothetical protein